MARTLRAPAAEIVSRRLLPGRLRPPSLQEKFWKDRWSLARWRTLEMPFLRHRSGRNLPRLCWWLLAILLSRTLPVGTAQPRLIQFLFVVPLRRGLLLLPHHLTIPFRSRTLCRRRRLQPHQSHDPLFC